MDVFENKVVAEVKTSEKKSVGIAWILTTLP